MTDITDTPETDLTAEVEAHGTDQEMAAADLPMVDQESGDEDDDGEPIVPNGRITLAELNAKTPVAPIDMTRDLACPLLGLFGNDEGRTWAVSHYRLKPA